MTHSSIIRKSDELIIFLDQQIDGLQMESDSRHQVAGACLDQALEHQKAIVLLVAKQLYGSAFSLVRLMGTSKNGPFGMMLGV